MSDITPRRDHWLASSLFSSAVGFSSGPFLSFVMLTTSGDSGDYPKSSVAVREAVRDQAIASAVYARCQGYQSSSGEESQE